MKFFQGLSFVVGSTEAEARARAAELDEYLSIDGLIAHRSGGIGIDLGGLDHDTPIGELADRVQGTRSTIESLVNAAPPGTNPTTTVGPASQPARARASGMSSVVISVRTEPPAAASTKATAPSGAGSRRT